MLVDLLSMRSVSSKRHGTVVAGMQRVNMYQMPATFRHCARTESKGWREVTRGVWEDPDISTVSPLLNSSDCFAVDTTRTEKGVQS